MPETVGLLSGGEYKSVPLQSFSQYFLTGGDLASYGSEGTSVSAVYKRVPWFRRAAELRANAVASMPRGIFQGDENSDDTDDVEVTKEAAYATFWNQQRRIYHLAEKSLFAYGSAYFIPEANRFGLNSRLRHVPSPAVQPVLDFTRGVTGFRVTTSEGQRELTLKEIVHIWLPNHESETEPGSPPGYAALESAGVLRSLDQMALMYFRGGGVPITAVIVGAATQQKEMDRLEGFFGRMATGVRNAFKYVLLKSGTTFETLGHDLKEAQATEMQMAERDNVAVAAGVPPTVIDGKAANFATANSEWLGFYLTTVIPECELIDEVLNEQFFARYGVKVRSLPKQLEIMQSLQLEQASAVAELVGRPILTVDEGRALVEYGPEPSLSGGGAGGAQQEEPAVGEPAAPGEPTADVQAQAMNGAQVAALLEVVGMYARGELTRASATAVIASSFPLLAADAIARILDEELQNAEVPAPAAEQPFGAQPAQPPLPAGAPPAARATEVEPDEDDEDDDEDKLKAWRRSALAAVGEGVGAPFDAELTACATRAQVRAVFERHWPVKREPAAAEIWAELVRARKAAERLAVPAKGDAT